MANVRKGLVAAPQRHRRSHTHEPWVWQGMDQCPRCGAPEPPAWDHLAWDCPSFAEGRPPPPADPLMRRLGWPQHPVNAYHREALAHPGRLRSTLAAD
eukprot:12859392-Prorocentrum_lima.AAC.1